MLSRVDKQTFKLATATWMQAEALLPRKQHLSTIALPDRSQNPAPGCNTRNQWNQWNSSKAALPVSQLPDSPASPTPVHCILFLQGCKEPAAVHPSGGAETVKKASSAQLRGCCRSLWLLSMLSCVESPEWAQPASCHTVSHPFSPVQEHPRSPVKYSLGGGCKCSSFLMFTSALS